MLFRSRRVVVLFEERRELSSDTKRLVPVRNPWPHSAVADAWWVVEIFTPLTTV